MLTAQRFFELFHTVRTDEVLVTTMASVRPWGRISSSQLDFASADSAMGHAADLALGIALAVPDRRVVCFNGDGSMLMTLGTLATVVDARVDNLVIFVMNNGVYEITGNQAIPGGRNVDFVTMARAVGFPTTAHWQTEKQCEQALPGTLGAPGPVLVNVAVDIGSEGPISRSPSEDAPYLQTSLAESARRLRKVLTQTT